ncbi:MAG: SsrA-binding protein SmpB [Candidatus Omnitrophica bacterium]|nr:SsrA-binding protein SmpB [Candidatus Omnitrophota bacterium]
MAKEKAVITNRQARRDYHIEKTYEAGLQLKGNEVKSLRAGNANLKGSFAKIENGELFLVNMHIGPYEFSQEEYDPLKPRKLLLHKTEIKQLITKLNQQGFTLVPLKVYFTRGYAKVEIALAQGKKFHDKRHALKEKQVKREMEKESRKRR